MPYPDNFDRFAFDRAYGVGGRETPEPSQAQKIREAITALDQLLNGLAGECRSDAARDLIDEAHGYLTEILSITELSLRVDEDEVRKWEMLG